MTSKSEKLSYLSMVEEAIKADGSRNGTSRQVIVKYLTDQFNVDPEKSKHFIKTALSKGVESGHLKKAKESGKGANSYKLGKPTAEEKAKKTPTKKTGNVKAAEAEPAKEKGKITKKVPSAETSDLSTGRSKASTAKKAKATTPKKSLVSKVKEAGKPKKTPTKKIGRKAAASAVSKK
uniref:Histone H1 n=1 Tax=Acartia pacifica TaxID=335913 RepID=R9TFS3_ACAPC|nr:histone H1 [Acartia pacifica]